MNIDETDIEHLALGSVFLATGGGGDPYIPKLLAQKIIKKFGSVELVKVKQLSDDALVVAMGGVGAPTVGLELLPSIDDNINALEAFEKHIGRKVDALVAFEVGGANSLVPIMAAAAKKIPVIDGDGMGRALPEAQMMTFAINGACPTPAISLDYAGNVSTFSAKNTYVYERHLRSLTQASGGMLTTVEHPMTGEFVKKSIVSDTLSFSILLGRFLQNNRVCADELIVPLKELFHSSVYGHCKMLFKGKITDNKTSVVNGFDVGQVVIESFDGSQPSMTIDIQNEYLVARVEDKVLASVPDLIVLVEYETSQPLNAERLKYGQRVAVFALACPRFFRSEAALAVVAPKCFGFNFNYVPLELID